MEIKTKHILHIIPSLIPSNSGTIVGGSANSLINILKYTSGIYQSTVIFGTSIEGKRNCIELQKRLPRVRFEPIVTVSPRGSNIYGLEILLKMVGNIIKRHIKQADVVHGHSGYYHYILHGWILSIILQAKVVHSLYCSIDNSIVRHKPFSVWLQKILLRLPNSLTGMTKNIYNDLIKVTDNTANNLHILPPIIDLDRYVPPANKNELREKFGFCPDDFIVLFVGNLSYSKGVDLFLEALEYLKNQIPNLKVVLTTEHSLSKRAVREEQMEHKIKSLGNLIRRYSIVSNMDELMGISNISIFPFRNTDGPSDYPIAMLESMATGTPSIGTNIGGIPEIINNGQTGFIVKPEIKDIAKKLLYVSHSQNRLKEMGIHASEFIKKTYSKERIIAILSSIYE